MLAGVCEESVLGRGRGRKSCCIISSLNVIDSSIYIDEAVALIILL